MSLEFKGIDQAGFGGFDLTDTILLNMKFWLDWGLLHHGAYGIYRLNDESYYSDSEDKLNSIYDERFGNGRVWNGVGREWVWESGVNIVNPPFRVSGVYVNSTFFPVGTTGPFSFHVDYQNGRIIFDNAMSPEDDVRAEYCHKAINVALADSPDFRTLMQNSVIEQITDILPSGTPTRENQIHLPAIFLDMREGTGRGLELGGGQIKTRTISLFVFADRASDRNLLMDWLDKQNRSIFTMADLNDIKFPFNYYGEIASGILNWPQMVTDYPGLKVRFMNSNIKKLDSINPNIFRARVDLIAEVDIGGI